MTVVIATRNRSDELSTTLEHLDRAIVASDEAGAIDILIVDDFSDEPLQIPCRLKASQTPVEVHRMERHYGAGLCRNFGVNQATGEYVAFLDDDVRVFPLWPLVVRRAVERGVQVGTGRIVGRDSSVVGVARQSRYERRYDAVSPYESVGFFAGGNSFIRTSLFLQAGGFPSSATGSDNGLLAKLDDDDESCRFIPEMIGFHQNGRGLRAAMTNAWRAAQNPELRSSGRAAVSDAVRHLVQDRTLTASLNVALSFVFAAGSTWKRLRVQAVVE